MKVSALIKLLKTCDPKAEVIVSSDSEGNSFSIVSDINSAAYRNDGFGIDIGLLKITPALKRLGYSSEDILEGGKPAVVIYP